MKDKKEEVIEETTQPFDLWPILFLMLSFIGSGKTDRQALVEQVSRSNLSEKEKKKIINILLG